MTKNTPAFSSFTPSARCRSFPAGAWRWIPALAIGILVAAGPAPSYAQESALPTVGRVPVFVDYEDDSPDMTWTSVATWLVSMCSNSSVTPGR